MNYYDIMILIHPNQSERAQDIIKKYKNIVEFEKGVIHKLEDLGKKQLAYQIKKLHKAHYVYFNIECTQKTLCNITSSIKFNDAIIRSLILKNKNN